MESNLEWDVPTQTGEEATLDPYANTVVSAPLPEPEAQNRADKIKIAFSGEENPPSYDDILSEVKTQREDRLKDRLAQSESLKKTHLKQQLIREVVDSGDASSEALSFLQGLSADEIVDKEGILERKYAEWRMNMGLSSDESGTVDRAAASNPEKFNGEVDASVDRITRFEKINRYRAEGEALYAQTGIGRTLVDLGFWILPLAEAIEARNITPDNVSKEGFWPGTSRRATVRDMFSMPMKEFDETLATVRQQAIDAGDYAPYLKLLKDLEEYSAYQGLVDNAWATVSTVELVPGIGLIDIPIGLGKAGVRAGGKAIATAEARRRATEAVQGAASTTPTSPGTKAAGEAPRPVSEAPVTASAGPTWDNLTPDYFKDGKKLTLYRGVGKNMGPPGPTVFWTTDPKKAAVYGKVQQIEVDQNDLKSFSVGHGGPDEFVTDNPKFGAVRPPETVLTEKEVGLAAVAEKASGNPKTLEELAEEINGSFTIDGKWTPRSGLLQEYNTALLSREILDRRTGEVVTAWGGDRYKITELTDDAMKAGRGTGMSPFGFIRLEKNAEGYYDIFINTDKIAKRFESKWWTIGTQGFRALPADTFKTVDEFRAFVIEHELTHILAEQHTPIKSIKNIEGIKELEERVNFNTLTKLGKVDAARKAYPEYYTRTVSKGPDPDVVPTPPKVEEVVKPKTYPTPQTIDVPGTQKKYQALKDKIKGLNEEIQKTYPKGSPKSAGVPDKGERRLSLQLQLSKAQEELAKVTKVIDSKPYRLHVKEREEIAKKISAIADRISFKSKYYPDLDGKAWQRKKASLEKELKAEQAKFKQTDRLNLNPKAELVPNTVSANDAVDSMGNKPSFSKVNPPKKVGPREDVSVPFVTVDIPNAATGGTAQVSVEATDETLTNIYRANSEGAAFGDMNDLPNQFAAHGDIERAATAEAINRVESELSKLKKTVEQSSKELARKLPTIMDPTADTIVGKPQHKGLYKLANNLAEKRKSLIDRQDKIKEVLARTFNDSQSMGALRWSDDVFNAVKDIAEAQTRKQIGSPSSAILDIKFLREWETTGRTNQVVYQLGAPDGTMLKEYDSAVQHAEDFYGLKPGGYSIRSQAPDAFYIEAAKVVDETDRDILKLAIQTDTKTPVSFMNTFTSFLRSPGEISSETLKQNLRISTHHANNLHKAFMVAAEDVGKLTKTEKLRLDMLMEAKRDVERKVIDPLTKEEKIKYGEWFNNATELENTYKKAFGEYPSENVTSAYFTMRQMYDFDLLYRNMKLYTEKVRMGVKTARPYIPIPDDKNPGMVKWVQMKEGFEAKPIDEMPSGNIDYLVLDPETAQARYFNTAKTGTQGVKDLQSKGFRLLQVAAPNQRPLQMVNDNYIQVIVAKDVEVYDLNPNQLPATEGGHKLYSEGVYLKQPKYKVTENGEKLYLNDTTILGMSSEAEGAKRMADYDTARQLLKAGDMVGLAAHLRGKIPMTVNEFASKFRPKTDSAGNIIEEAQLDIDTPIVWVREGQGTNDAAKTHAPQLLSSFDGVRDTIDDPMNIMGVIGKKYTGEKDSTLEKIVERDGIIKFERARMISPMETLEKAWAEISRGVATDNMKIQATTNWVEEAAAALETPIEELRRNPWAALNNPQWNRQYGDVAKIRTLDAQRRQILYFLGQKDDLGTTLDWLRNKMLNSVFEKKGQAGADWVDDHILPNVRNPLAFARSFAFHTKMGFFNPIQLFLQSNTMINTWAITGNPARVGSALSGVTLMQMSRINRTPEILADLARKSEKLGWKAGEWAEMDAMFHRIGLDTVAGEVGTLDVMTNPKLFKGVGGMFLDKGLMFFREGERAVRMNAWAVAYKEFRDKFPTKVINNADENRILSRMEVLAGMMTRADNALWQKGITSPMTQFWGYQARVMELLLGKQLTRAEKLRLGTAFAAMYGMPVSLAAATMFQIPGWSTDDLRQYALENNIDINSGPLSVAMNGIPAELIRWMTSDENGQGGLLLNIGGRYGPGGLPVIKNLIEAKDGVTDAVIDLAFGASGSITRDFFKQVMPDDWDIIESATNPSRLTMVDFANMFSTISTVNNATKLYWATTTHRNMTKDGLNLGDKSSLSAFISFTTGLEEQRFQDTFLKLDSLKDLRTATEELGGEYVKQIRQAKLLPIGSEERARRIKKARALLDGMDPKNVKKFVKRAYRSSDSLETSIERGFKKEF